MRSPWLLALAASGCRGVLGIESAVVVDAATDAPALCAGWQPEGVEPCAFGTPAPALHLGPGRYTLDTTDGGGALTDAGGAVLLRSAVTFRQADQSEAAVITVEALAIDAGAIVNAIGKQPLIVVAWSTIAIDGELDASSHLDVVDVAAHLSQTTRFGAGANAGCAPPRTGGDGASGATVAGSGGGGGGGGDGAASAGAGGHGAAPLGGGGPGGDPATGAALHGGCPGGASGVAGTRASSPASPTSLALGGAGGGALRLIAYQSIRITGTLSANGAGGAGAPTASVCGGGGGGGGGQLRLDAASVRIDGIVAANGGGGGGGGDTPTRPGSDGADGDKGRGAAPGGVAVGCGLAGGDGAALVQPIATAGTTATCGGGGGGGGAAGSVVIASPDYAALGTAIVSPAPRLTR